MKKFLLFTAIILFAFLSNVYAQTPTNLSSANITANSVDLNWDPVSCSGNVNLRYRITGTTAWANFITQIQPSQLPFNLNSLVNPANDPIIPSTSYDWAVKCAGPNPWAPTQTFTTLCSGVFGCTDALACNFDSLANCDDGSCVFPDGCTDATACNYNASATCDDGSCVLPDGCTDATACNYDASANCDDGSCVLPDGCTDATACNYDASATCDDGSCVLPDGCTDITACNYDASATCDDGSCIIPDGCTDITACNYDPLANCDDGSCSGISGCTDILAFNYNSLANCDDGSCVNGVLGCIDPLALNFNLNANIDDGSCVDSLLAPTIDTAFVSQQIPCFGGTGEIQIDIVNDSVIIYSTLVGYFSPTFPALFVSYSSTNNSNGTTTVLSGLLSGVDYVVRIVDSLAYYAANPFGSGTSPIGIYDEFGVINLSEPNQLTANISSVENNLCNADCIAEVEVAISGGTQPYNYTLDTNPIVYLGAPTPQLHTINSGNFYYNPMILTINIGDTVRWINDGGFHDVNFDVNSITGISYNNPQSFISPQTSGFIIYQHIFTIDGNYEYDCSVGSHAANGMTGQIIVNSMPVTSSIDTIENLCAGLYTLQVSDANSCLTSPSPITFSIDTITAISTNGSVSAPNPNFALSCNGDSDGYIIPSASGSAGSFQYSIDGTNFTSVALFDSLTEGSYTISYKDSNECLASETLILNEPPVLSGLASISQVIDCYGSSSGEITFFIDATQTGVPTYNYSLNGGLNFQSDSVFSSLTGDSTYTILVEDNNLCQFTDSIFMTQPTPLTVDSIIKTDITCNGLIDGTATVINPSGGTPYLSGSAYTYLWSDGQITNTASGLTQGSYNCTIFDFNSCSLSTSSVIIIEPSLITISSIDKTDITCNNASNGTATLVNISGGTPSTVGDQYTYDWIDQGNGLSINQFDSIATSLDDGSYSCLILDANLCSLLTIPAIIIEPNIITADPIIQTNITCNGSGDGSATIPNINGGTPYVSGSAYTFLWSDGQTTNPAINLDPGAYSCIVNDANNCNFTTANVNITQPLASISVDTVVKTDITCNGLNNGTASVLNVSGGTPFSSGIPYSYNWIDQDGLPIGQFGPIATGLSAGTYACILNDATGNCPLTTNSVIIIDPALISIDSVIVSPISCFGECDASILSIQSSGGTPFNSGYSYLYSINGGLAHPNSSYFNDYCADTYTLQVRDINGCVSSKIVIIDEPQLLNVEISTSLWNNYQIRCYGDSSGTANLTISGGVAPYTKNLYDALVDTLILTTSNNIFTGLKSGEYKFEVIDSNGCTYLETISYNEPTLIMHHFIPTHVTCSDWSNGSLIDSVYGGVGNSSTYNYMWNTGEMTYSLSALPVDTFVMTVTDENNCISVDSFIINDDNALEASILVTNVSCYNYCDGELTVNAVGGLPNFNSNGNPTYNYSWNDTLSQITQSAVGLCVNNNSFSTTYECIVTDVQGCSVNLSGTIIQPIQLSVTANIIEDVLCFSGTNGKLNANVSGGSAPYEYMWSNNSPNYSPNSSNNGLISGEYIITVKDNEGCIAADFVTLDAPTELYFTSIIESSVTCFGFNNGKIIAVADGGTPFLGIPPEYLYTVKNDFGATVYSVTKDSCKAENLSPGIYTIQVQDMNSCIIESGTIYISEPGDSLSIIFNTVDASCMQSSGSVSINVDGGTPNYQFNWDNGITTSVGVGLATGYYPVTVVDMMGCEVRDSAFVKGTNTVFADSLSQINYNICLGDSVLIRVNESSLNTYVWENGSTITQRWVYPNNYINVYTLTITDPNCLTTYDVDAIVNVDFVDPMLASNPVAEYGDYPIIISGESIELFSSNNTCVEYIWQWKNDTIINTNGTIDIVDIKNSEWYYLYVKDNEGCLGYDSIYVVVGVLPYEAITPNNDGFNDSWTPLDIQSYENALVQVFNRWGGIVFESTGGADYQPWDGTSSGKELAIGTYYYIIDLKSGDEIQTGTITIIR